MSAAASTPPQPSGSRVSEEEYLRTSYERECELIDGFLLERPMPTSIHGFVQMLIGSWFITRMMEWGVAPESEVRTRVRPANFRIPDVSVTAFATTFPKVQDGAPMIAIEIRFEDDRPSDLRKRAGDLHAMGVRHIWLIDPDQRTADVWSDGGVWEPARELRVAGSPIYLDLEWLWAQIDSRLKAGGERDAPKGS